MSPVAADLASAASALALVVWVGLADGAPAADL
jgi:hypothetical protein